MATHDKPKLLLLGQIDKSQDTWSEITATTDVVELTTKSREDVISQLKQGIAEGVSVVYTAADTFSTTGPFDDELLDGLPKTTKFICHSGLAYDQIDIGACTTRSILVSNVPTASADATVDLALWLLLSCFRNLLPATISYSQLPPLGHNPRGKTLGLVGVDVVARRLATRANVALGMRVLYHTPERLDPEHENDLGSDVRCAASLEELLRNSDAISLHMRPPQDKQHVLSAPEFTLAKPTAVLINVSSIDFIDQAALAEALTDKRLAAAGIDAPLPDGLHRNLREHPRAIVTPGVAAHTIETQAAVQAWALDNVRKAFEEGGLTSVVPEQRQLEVDSAARGNLA